MNRISLESRQIKLSIEKCDKNRINKLTMIFQMNDPR